MSILSISSREVRAHSVLPAAAPAAQDEGFLSKIWDIIVRAFKCLFCCWLCSSEDKPNTPLAGRAATAPVAKEEGTAEPPLSADEQVQVNKQKVVTQLSRNMQTGQYRR